MIITKQTENDRTTIALEGRLDTLTAPQLEAYLEQEVTPKDTFLVIDMEKLEYISSAGLRVLLALQKEMQQHGAMELHNVNEVNMEVFEVTGFVDILTIV